MVGKRMRSRATQGNNVPSSRPSVAVAPVNTTAVNANTNTNPSVARTKFSDDLLTLTKEQLKVECRKRGQKTTGTKTELLQRLGHKMSTKRNVTVANAASNGAAIAPTVTLGSRGPEGPTSNTNNSNNTSIARQQKQKDRDEREGIVLWRRPITTIEYFTKEMLVLLNTYGQKLLHYKITVLLLISAVLLSVFILNIGGPHQLMVQQIYKKLLWCSYWIGLGILSSVGLGTGLHTFLLYLGPHIAQVTLASYECGSLDFPEPPYPDEIVCPETQGNPMLVTILAIMSKVRLESMCWGAGTALGELPPYFMARAARLSGMDPDDDDDDLAQFEELQRKKKDELTLMERGKLFIEHIVQKVGFFGILACASIPNPLFDLAGITCGHFLVPFWTFFGATLVGKAIVKMHIQKLFVIIAFNETLIGAALAAIRQLPVIGTQLVDPFKAFLDGQKTRLHRGNDTADGSAGGSTAGGGGGGGGILAAVFEKFVFAMIVYFLLSIVNSFAQSYHKRITKKRTNGKQAKD